MKVWLYVVLFAVGTAGFVLLLSVIVNLTVAWLARRYSKKTLKKGISDLEKLLPGTNCGMCGCETCEAYARELFACRMEADRCIAGGAELQKKLEESMERFQKTLEGK